MEEAGRCATKLGAMSSSKGQAHRGSLKVPVSVTGRTIAEKAQQRRRHAPLPSSAQRAELRRRLAAHEAEPLQVVPWETVRVALGLAAAEPASR
ncbi:addiction module protein [Inhella sp.]|uniref:addiction module protein n=1 Tax=Inhella sp. TaxID=1921806 RepID=UPI0035B05868